MKRKREVVIRKNNKKVKTEICPDINNIKDLIKICKEKDKYENIDKDALKKILPSLEELDKLIGMNKLKESILFQILYYLQKMHIPPNSKSRTFNKNEEYLHTVIQGSPGTGKCLGKDTKVMLYNGDSINVQDIKIGDKIMGDDSKERKILNITKGIEQLWEIEQSYGKNYIVNESHILSLVLTENPIITYDIYKNYKLYWCDYYGYHTKNFLTYNQAKIFVKTLPKIGDIIDISIKEYICRNNIWKRYYKGYKVFIDYNEKEVEKDGYEYGVEIINNDIEHIDHNYLYNSKEIRLEVLAGIIDCYDIHDINSYNIIIDNKYIFNFIVKLCTSLCIRLKIKKDNNIYYINIYGNINNIPSRNIRVVNNYKVLIKNKIIYDIKLNKKNIGEYYGFEINGNRRFVLDDYTVTHNTTVAKILGDIYKNLGILSKKGQTIMAYRDDFIGEHLGSTALKTRDVLTNALGGVLIIDEVYALGNPDGKDSFSKEAIDTINSFLSEYKDELCCIIVGYEKEINNCFFKFNPGLKRRFPWIYNIEDYTEKDLTKILLKKINDINWKLDTDITDIYLNSIIKENKIFFKNCGGDIETFISKLKMLHSKRVFSLPLSSKFIITKEDINNTLNYLGTIIKKKKDDFPMGLYL